MLRHGRTTFRGMLYTACGPTIYGATTRLAASYARMMVTVQACVCICVDELATESESEERESYCLVVCSTTSIPGGLTEQCYSSKSRDTSIISTSIQASTP